MKPKKPQGRPRKSDKKIIKSVALPPALWKWLDSKPMSRAVKIEDMARKDGFK